MEMSRDVMKVNLAHVHIEREEKEIEKKLGSTDFRCTSWCQGCQIFLGTTYQNWKNRPK
jgi:hypothetical protein